MQIWNSNLVIDDFMGQGLIMAQPLREANNATANGESAAAKSVYQGSDSIDIFFGPRICPITYPKSCLRVV